MILVLSIFWGYKAEESNIRILNVSLIEQNYSQGLKICQPNQNTIASFDKLQTTIETWRNFYWSKWNTQ